MPLELQVKLLRVLEDGLRPAGRRVTERGVDVRLVCATNRDLQAEVEPGAFRRDLFYRLNVLPDPPPAAPRTRWGRRASRPALSAALNAASGKRLGGIATPALRCLQRYPWPGNVRELKNEVERAVALAEPGDQIDLPHLSVEVTGDQALAAVAKENGKLMDRLERIEQLLILEELHRHGDNRTHTARSLGISVRALQKKIGKYGLRDREG